MLIERNKVYPAFYTLFCPVTIEISTVCTHIHFSQIKKSFASGQVTFTDSRYGIYGAKCAVGSGQVPCAIVKEGVQNNKEMYDFVDKILKYVWPRCNDIWKTEMNKLLKELKKAAICNGSGGGQFKLYFIIITQVIFGAFLAKYNEK